MKIINKVNLKKYAINYLKRYASSKKNLKNVLLRKIKKYEYNNSAKQKQYGLDIIDIIEDLENKKILNDESFANTLAFRYVRMGKSKKFIEYTLIKKGINKENINNTFINLENEIPDLEFKSAINFARKKKLGKFGNKNNKQKDLNKMSNSGFSYNISLKVLGYN